jgi:prepilin-type N-terminal cleavage/methylation domain-containing protein
MKNIFKLNKNINSLNRKGFSLVEVLIACTLISVTTLSLMSAASKGIELSSKAIRQVQASMLIEEGIEAVKSIRDTNWTTISNLTLGTTYYLSFDSNTNVYSLTTTPVSPVDGMFTRTVVLSAVNRDANDDIVATGTVDTGIKRVDVIVSWNSPSGTTSKNITFYLTNIFN